MLDNWMLLVSISLPFSGLPQIHRMYKTKSSKDVSLIMWCILLHGQMWFTYWGLLHNDIPILTTNMLSSVISFILITLTLRYKS